MAITYSLAPNPHWVVIDDFSKLPIGAAIYTYSSLNPSVFKPAYEDAGGTTPFGQPIVGFANGTFPPIFWKFDSSAPDDLYYIQVWSQVQDSSNTAVLLWDFNGISGGGSGGGGVITNNLDLENLVINGQFFRNVGNLPIAPATSLDTLITLAPSNHDGFCGNGGTTFGPVGPDIIFAKSDQSAQDSILFTDFQQGDNFFGSTPTPKQFVEYKTVVAGSETYKYIQFPIVKGLQNLNNTTISIKMWNYLVGNSTNINLVLRQFFGNGNNGPSSDVITPITALNLSAGTWTLTQLNSFSVPSIAGKTLGNCGNDALYLQIQFPSSELIDLKFILPAIYLGAAISTTDFHTLDQVDAIVNSPRTGDTRTSINSFSPYGWVPANDGTIGSGLSSATTRANIDTFPLYDLIWNSIPDIYAPVTGGRGASSIDDFVANKPMALTRNLGRVMAGALATQITQGFTTPVANTLTVTSTTGFNTGAPVTVSASTVPALVNGTTYYVRNLSATTLAMYPTPEDAIANTNVITFGIGAGIGNVIVAAHALGQYLGEEKHIQTISEMPSHNHPPLAPNTNFVETVGGGAVDISTNPGVISVNFPTTTGNTGGGAGFNIMQPTVYMNVFIKL